MNEPEKPVEAVKVEVVTPPESELQKTEVPPLLVYLMSDRGHEFAVQILEEIKDWRRIFLDKNLSHAKHERWLQVSLIVAVLLCICLLSFYEKLNPTVAVVMGSVVGYFFGKGKA